MKLPAEALEIGASPVRRFANLSGIVLVLFTLLLGGLVGYLKLFTTWAAYDDEGYVLVTLQSYAQGQRLYDEIFSQYGPGFYQIETLLQWVCPHDYTSETQRFKTLVLWLLTAVVAGGTVLRMISHVGIASAAGMTIFLHLDRLALEPGHPQMWCVAITSLVLFWLTYTEKSAHRCFPWLVTGVFCGLLVVIKPNVGGLVAGGVLAALIWSNVDRRNLIGRTTDGLFSFLIVAGPWFLFKSVLYHPGAWLLPTVTSVALCSWRAQCIRYASHHDQCNVRAAVLSASLGLGSMMVLVTSICVELLNGVSLVGLKRGLIGQHASLIQQFYHDAPLPALAWSVAGALVLAMIREVFRGVDPKTEAILMRGTKLAALVLIGWGIMAIVSDIGQPLQHGLMPHGAAGLMSGIGALIVSRSLFFLKDGVGLPNQAALVGISILAPLGAFPTPGTQMAVGTVGVWVVLWITAFRFVRFEKLWGTSSAANERITLLRGRYVVLPLVRFGSIGLLALFALVPSWQIWSHREPLGVPGAQRLRLDPATSKSIHAIVQAIQDNHADTLAFTWHNRNSFYGWANLRPPTGQSPTFWPYLLSQDQQTQVLKSISSFPRILVVDEDYNPAILPRISELQKVLKSNMVPIGSIDGFQLGYIDRPKSSKQTRLTGTANP